MPFQTVSTGSTIIVAWDRPMIEDVNAVVSLVHSANLPVDGTKLTYVAYIPDAMKAPEPEVRAAMVRSINKLLERCEHLHFILEGSGFGPSIGRSVMAGIILAAGQRGRIHIHASVEEADGHLSAEAVTRLSRLRIQHLAG